jgi:uncharacterized protein (DUF1810 family)
MNSKIFSPTKNKFVGINTKHGQEVLKTYNEHVKSGDKHENCGFSKIVNPKTGKLISTYGQTGGKVVKSYNKVMRGGAAGARARAGAGAGARAAGAMAHPPKVSIGNLYKINEHPYILTVKVISIEGNNITVHVEHVGDNTSNSSISGSVYDDRYYSIGRHEFNSFIYVPSADNGRLYRNASNNGAGARAAGAPGAGARAAGAGARAAGAGARAAAGADGAEIIQHIIGDRDNRSPSVIARIKHAQNYGYAAAGGVPLRKGYIELADNANKIKDWVWYGFPTPPYAGGTSTNINFAIPKWSVLHEYLKDKNLVHNYLEMVRIIRYIINIHRKNIHGIMGRDVIKLLASLTLFIWGCTITITWRITHKPDSPEDNINILLTESTELFNLITPGNKLGSGNDEMILNEYIGREFMKKI